MLYFRTIEVKFIKRPIDTHDTLINIGESTFRNFIFKHFNYK